MKKETKLRASGIIGKVSSLVLSTALLASTFTGLGNSAAFTAQAASSPTSSAAIVPSASGDLPDHIYDGVILHAWNWSFNAIKDNLAAIADAGYVAVQTSPVQRPKEYSQSSDQTGWWKVYQPTTLSFSPGGHPWFGSKDDFKAMCEEADKYGIKIIVDVVANHLANNSGKIGNSKSDISDQNDPTYKNDDSCWHLNGSTGIDYNNPRRDGSTSSLTHGFGGWPDLNTGNKKVQNGVIDLLKECIDLGADGFRFDAAKHIELPTDPGGVSDFWPTVINAANNYAQSKGVEIYSYGEILDDPGTDIKNYTKYIAVTDNRSSNSTRYGIYENNIGKAASSWLKYDGVSYDKIVLWSESHDTYANNNYSGESAKFSQDQINRSWAIVAARQFPSLYYIRPDNPSNAMGQASKNTAWKNKEVAEVNKFHNAFVGESEYMSSSGNTVLIERGTTGVVLVNISGNGGQFSGKVNKMKDGTYTDQVSGNTFTVSGGNISGSIGSKGIAVVYNATNSPRGSVSATPTDTSFIDTITVTLNANNVTNAKYTTSEGNSGSFTSGQKLTLGSSTSIGSSVTLNLSGTKPDGTTATAKYSYLKKNPNEVTTIYFDNSTYNWNHVYAYVYKPSDDPPPPPPQSSIQFTNSLNWWSVKAYFFNGNGTVGAEWPGTDMTCIGDNGYGSVNYEISIPSGAEMVVFNDGGYGAQTKDLPISGVAGYWLDGSADNAIPWYNPSAEAPSSVAPGDEDTTPCNAKWPGVEMTYDSATKLYKYVVPEAFKDGLVIFSDGAQDTTNRYPGDMEEGLPINDTSKLFSANHSWKDYTAPVPQKLSVSLSVSPSSVKVGEKVTLTATASNATGTVTYTFKAGSETISSSGNTASWTASSEGTTTITVTAKDSNGTATDSKTVTVSGNPDPDGPKVIADKASGTSFYTETLSVKLTLQNAVSGTYCIDNGSVKKFTGSVTVPVGQGKIGDTTVSVKATAKGSDGTEKTFSFTYEKKYKIKTTSSSAASSCDKFVTNPNGAVGKKKTITSASGIGCLPYDDVMLDVAREPYSADDSTSQEKEDADKITVALASVGKGGSTPVSPTTPLQVNFGADRAAPQLPTTKLTLKGIGMGGTAPYTYAFYVNDKLVQADSSKDSCTFTPGTEGDYTLKCIIKDSTGKTATVTKTFTAEASDDDNPTVLTNKSTLSSTQTIDFINRTSVTVKAAATGGQTPYTYAYFYKKSTESTYKRLKDYSTSASYVFKPDSNVSATYNIKVKIKDAGGSVASKVLNIKATALAKKLTNTSTISAQTIKLGSKLTVNCSAVGGKTPYKFAVYYKKSSSSKFTTAQNYSTNKTVYIKPGAATVYDVKIKLKDAEGSTEVVKIYQFAVIDPDSNNLKNTSKVSSTSMNLGSTLTISGASTGGSGTVKYAAYYKKGSSDFKRIRDYSTTAKMTFKPSSAGTYTIRIKVRDSKTVVNKDVKVTVTNVGLTNKSTVSTTSLGLGNTLTINCAATGGAGGYTYSAYYKKSSSSSFTKIRGYSSNTTMTVTPATATKYIVRVKVKDKNGKVVNKDFNITVSKTSTSNPLTNTSSLSATTVKLGNSITVKCSATGGKTTYKYAVAYKKASSDNYTSVSGYTTTKTFTVKPAAATTYQVRVKVKDANGTIKIKVLKFTAKK